jgi:adenosylcobinamide-GDP ribazoletransferase
VIDGVRLALTTLTVLPVRAGRIDRRSAAVAMSLAPLVGALLGAVLGLLLAGLRAAHAPGLLAAAVTVTAGVLLTRALHLDGLADTADGLGSYRRGAEALDIMKKSDIGPFGVVAIGLTLLLQTAAVTGLSPWSLPVAWAAGRLAVGVACRPSVPAARPDGLGTLVAGTVPPVVTAGCLVVVAAAAWPGHGGPGPVAVAVAVLAAYGLVGHCVRRFGGITGDVIGAAVEVATTVALAGLTLS